MTPCRLLALSSAVLIAGCGPTPGSPPTGIPRHASTGPPRGASAPASPLPSAPAPAGAGCVDEAGARRVWTDIDTRLNAVVLDPKHAGLEAVVTGSALADLRDYIANRLVANHWTEHEVDALDSLKVTSPGCGGGLLRMTVSVRATIDDYLRPDGTVDHHDQAVGSQLHLIETYLRVDGTWKKTSLLDFDASPAPSGPIV